MAHENGLELHGRAHSDPTRASRGSVKQRNRVHSCDLCRQKKIRCIEMPTTSINPSSDNAPNTLDGCSNCATFGLACTYSKPQKKRGPKATRVEELTKKNTSLKRENATLKDSLRSLSMCSRCFRPLDLQLLKALSKSLQEYEDDSSKSASIFQTSTPDRAAAVSVTEDPPDDRDLTGDDLAERFSQFSIESMKTKHFGSASTFALANSIAIEEEDLGQPLSHSGRPSSLNVLPWEQEAYGQQRRHVYPANDLIAALLNLYFKNVHPTIPILNRPSFERSVAEGLHFRDMKFGGMLLSVLAVAARYSDDPRVFIDGRTPLSAGWKFANEAWSELNLSEATIHEVQMYFLLTLYTKGSSVPQVSWLYLGLGIRCLQQRVEFRRKPTGSKPGLEDELWKRVFWLFVIYDRMNCLFLGRPVSLQVEDYDVDLPLEVDEEYWDRGFTQPLGKPSQLSFLACHIRLSEILGDAMRKLYGSKESKKMMGYDGPEWEQRVVAELDSAMNGFVDSIPLHLRWDPENPPGGTFFDQAATLQIVYNHILIAIHRPNIQRVNVQGTPSLSICARAARTIIRTADMWFRKLQRIPLFDHINAVFLAGVTLVLCILGTKRAGLLIDRNNDLDRVETAMEILKFAGSRLKSIGSLSELLRDLRYLDGATPESSLEPSLLNPPSVYRPEQYSDLWNGPPSPGQPPTLKPGMSIEQLLESVGEPSYAIESMLDDQLMSMWMAGPPMWPTAAPGTQR
ncbi:fungal-specific transcription factor domain-containing protein [Mycena albidolilacea]|uniref:Fungal-specific transcription factor domain-containing protein n=1 Tax=Mycena albidolilacea TaxID=1033008 RepID=A0AAD7APC4_9AGAR|nr:fungal-specific transcription factor domain-containing protein [Mycena albidolilacea]